MQRRNRDQKIDLLKSVPLFQYLSKQHLAEVAKHTDQFNRPAGETLMREGDRGQELFILVSGKATVTRGGTTIATLGPGDFVGEMALIDDKPRSATVTADEDLSVLAISVQEFKPLLQAVPDMAEKLLKSLARRLRAADESLA